jgi:hypothetical protein
MMESKVSDPNRIAYTAPESMEEKWKVGIMMSKGGSDL